MTNEKCFEVHAELVVRPTGQDVDDIMVSALEGGICYWCDRVTVEGQYLGKYASEQISRGGTLKVHVTEPFDEQDTEWYELDIEKFIQGFRLWLENRAYWIIASAHPASISPQSTLPSPLTAP